MSLEAPKAAQCWLSEEVQATAIASVMANEAATDVSCPEETDMFSDTQSPVIRTEKQLSTQLVSKGFDP